MTLTSTAVTTPRVWPVVRPDFCTRMPTDGGTGSLPGTPILRISPLDLTVPGTTSAIARSTLLILSPPHLSFFLEVKCATVSAPSLAAGQKS